MPCQLEDNILHESGQKPKRTATAAAAAAVVLAVWGK
jgi:hypothetical protein